MLKSINLSVVIIGRNEEKNIKRCIDSVKENMVNFDDYEIIYVDSCSEDKTLDYVKEYPDIKIYQIACTERLTASKGRYIGAINSSKDYILFLDGDMELIEGWIEDAIQIIKNYEEVAGIVGIRYDVIVYPNNQEKIIQKNYPKKQLKKATHFGGAVLLKRKALISVGNYSPNIIAEEERELYSRFLKNGKYILEFRKPMIKHYIPYTKHKSKLKRLFISKRHYGIGQGFINSIRNKSFKEYLYIHRFYFLGLLTDIISLLLIIFSISIKSFVPIVLLLIAQILLLIINIFFNKWTRYFTNKILALYFIPGLFTYKKDEEIQYKKIR